MLFDLGAGGLGSITFIARNGDLGETLSLHAGNPQLSPPLGAPWGTVTVNDGTLTTVTMPVLAATSVPGVINQVLHVWDGDLQTVGGITGAPPSAALSLGVSIAQGTDASETITMIGLGGMASGYDGNDTIIGTAFNDFIDGGRSDDTLSGGVGNDTIVGGEGIDSILGGSGEDVLWGGASNDILNGGGDNDTLIGGLCRDTMTGGAGANTFFFGTGPFNSVTEDDTITDFFKPLGDKLWFLDSLLLTTGYDNGVNPLTNIAGGNWFINTATPAVYGIEDRFIFDQTTGQLFYDADGLGGAASAMVVTLAAPFNPGVTLVNTDFLFTPTGP